MNRGRVHRVSPSADKLNKDFQLNERDLLIERVCVCVLGVLFTRIRVVLAKGVTPVFEKYTSNCKYIDKDKN